LRRSRLENLRDAGLAIAVLGLLTFWLVKAQLKPLRQLQDRARHLFDPGQDMHEGWPAEAGEIGSVVQVLRHVGAERAQLESFTHQLLGKLDSVMAAAPLGIGFTRHQRFELISKAWCRMLQREESELLGSPARQIFASDDDYERLGTQVREAFGRAGDYAGEWRFRRKDGSEFWGQLCGRPVDPLDVGAGTIWTLSDISDSRASRESLEWSAKHDPLTGLANRAAFEERLKAVIDHPPAAVLVMDLDRFKPINDAHGHRAGDAMLKLVAAALTAHVRTGDLVVRTGGDEFAVILERCPADAAQRVAAEVQRAIARVELAWEGQRLTVGASVGVAPLTDLFNSIEAWVAAADEACYAAKAAGRGTVRLVHGRSGNVVELARPNQSD
jgi:diguanylate cyclase (GGDEF)-like protein/PAS domain S-box-containing protein